MNEKLIDVYEVFSNDYWIITTIIQKDNKYLIEKCIIKNNTIRLIYKNELDNLKTTYKKFNDIKTTT